MNKKRTSNPTSSTAMAVYAARLKRRLRRSPRARASYLNAALDVAPLVDEEPFLAALWGVVRANGGKERVAEMSGISVERLEEATDDDADFATIVTILKFFDLRFDIAPIPPSTAALAAEIRASHHLNAAAHERQAKRDDIET